MSRESVIGTKIFERVEEMRAEDPTLTQQAAFLRLSTEMDKKPATIGANYYRMLRNRQKANAAARRARSAERKAQAERGMEPQPRRKSTNRNGQVVSNLDEMAKLMHDQIDALMAQYKKEHEDAMRVAKIREALS